MIVHFENIESPPPSFELSSITAEVVENVMLAATPRWEDCFRELIVGTWTDMQQHEDLYCESAGSGNWYSAEWEEFFFTSDTLMLRSLWFHVPETNIDLETELMRWLEVEPVEGLLKLQLKVSWGQEILDHRYLSPDGKHLLGGYARTLQPEATLFRLHVGKDINLLFENGRFWGWLLNNPSQYINRSVGEMTQSGIKSEPLGITKQVDPSLLYEYVNLISEADLETIVAGYGYEYMDRLRAFQTKISALDQTEAYTAYLRYCIDDVVDGFSGYLRRDHKPPSARIIPQTRSEL